MKPASTYFGPAALTGGLLALALAGLCGCGQSTPAPGTTPAKTNAPVALAAVKTNAAAPVDMTQFVSTFEDLPAPQGRDPFYPNSHRRAPVATVSHNAAAKPADTPLTLKGIVGSGRQKLAVINNEILAPGESSPVRVGEGHVKVKCLEIGDDYVMVQVEGEPGPKRLSLNPKK